MQARARDSTVLGVWCSDVRRQLNLLPKRPNAFSAVSTPAESVVEYSSAYSASCISCIFTVL